MQTLIWILHIIVALVLAQRNKAKQTSVQHPTDGPVSSPILPDGTIRPFGKDSRYCLYKRGMDFKTARVDVKNYSNILPFLVKTLFDTRQTLCGFGRVIQSISYKSTTGFMTRRLD